jgi:hypothetical protein
VIRELDTKNPPAAIAKATASRSRWLLLAKKVRQFQPTVVVLIARKAPRIAQAFELEFGTSALVVSDLAIPFCTRELRNARVAIIDDTVNVGSTLLHARSAVLEAGAAEVRMFVVANSASTARLTELEDLIVADPTPLQASSREALSAEIPGRLQALGRPYDLDFPLLHCHLPAEKEGFLQLSAALSERYGSDSVYDLSTPMGAEAGVRRLTVDLSDAVATPMKIRIYLNQRDGMCVLAPIKLQTPIPVHRPEAAWARAIWDELGTDTVDDVEARGRLRIFLDSLAVGFEFVRSNCDVFLCDSEHPLLRGEAELTFGPRITEATRFLAGWPFLTDKEEEEPASAGDSCSPFLPTARASGLVDAVEERIEGAPDELSAFIALFNTLAEWVGADNPSQFRLGWPMPAEAIQREPYQRLRIGPTFADLVVLIDELAPNLPHHEARPIVSRLLDRFIDEGGVVPTTAVYKGKLYRIYRKGEKDPRDRISLRTRRAWQEYGRPLSLTRVSKLSAILAFSEDVDASDTAVATLERGNVFCHARTVLHDEAEISHRLLRTNQLERARTNEN